MAATPQRITVLAAKATVFAVVTFVVTTLAAFAAFFVGQAILSGKDLGVAIGAPGALRSVVGTGLYLAVLGLLSLGLGTLLRKTAGAIAALFGILFHRARHHQPAAQLDQRHPEIPTEQRGAGDHLRLGTEHVGCAVAVDRLRGCSVSTPP